MISAREIITLIQKDARHELRLNHVFSSLLVYVLSTVFIVYITFVELAVEIWNVLFWIVFLFAASQAVLKSFVRESSRQYLYYYTLVPPISLLISKMLYNAILLLCLGLLLFGALTLVGGNYLERPAVFGLALILGSIGIGWCLTFISAIAIKSDNSATLMAILAFPLIIPILLNLIRLSAVALGTSADANIWNEVTILLSIDLLLVGLGFMLFPYLWKS